MRILSILDAPPDPDSGMAGTEVQTVVQLRRLGHNVDAVWGDELPHRIRHGNLHYALELPTALRKVMLAKAAHGDYDVVHVNQPHGYLAARAHAKGRMRGVFIHRSHGFESHVEAALTPWRKYDHQDERSLLRRVLGVPLHWALDRHYRAILRWADGHIVYSTLDKQFLEREMGVASERIAVVPAAAPDVYLGRPALRLDAARLKRILYVGQYAFFKGPSVVAKVLNRVLAEAHSAEATWVCGAQHHDSVRRLLVGRARDSVNLVSWQSQEELLEVFDTHGIFLFPSLYEGFGKVFLEAMARGLCVVASDVGGAHDVISHGQDGLLVSAGDVDGIAAACASLWGDPTWAASLSDRAAATARLYTWNRAARETEAFYVARLKAKSEVR